MFLFLFENVENLFESFISICFACFDQFAEIQLTKLLDLCLQSL